jgi:hypothetical protein
MYGIINKAIEDLVKHNYGEGVWDSVKKRSGVDIEYFVSNETYDDAITYQLAEAIAVELDISLGQVLVTFGEWWVLHSIRDKYGKMIQAGGSNLREFLINLPMFHNRVMMIYPKLTPPEFQISHIEDSSLHVHYISKRPGLQEFVRGLLQGLGKLYSAPVTIELIQSRENGSENEIFKVSW